MKWMIGLVLAACVAGNAWAKNPVAVTNLTTAIAQAQEENKLLFILYGQPGCSNCQALRSYVAKNVVRLSPGEFVYADVYCDEPVTRGVFAERFKVSGGALPFVVIADPQGQQLAERCGFGEPKDFDKLIRDARKAGPKSLGVKTRPGTASKMGTSAGVPRDENREMRSWTSNGRQIRAALLDAASGYASLKREDGTVMRVMVGSLSQEDQSYIRRHCATGDTNAPPPTARTLVPRAKY